MPSLNQLILEGRRIANHRPCARAVVDPAVWAYTADQLADGHWTLLDLWGETDAVHMALLDTEKSDLGVVSLDCPDGRFPSVGARHAPALRLERDDSGSLRAAGEGPARCAALARPRPVGRARAAGLRRRRPGRPARLIPSCRPKARACIRSRSVPCMRGSSNRGISGSPPTGRPSSAWKRGWATCTRGSRALWRAPTSLALPGWPRGRPATAPSPMRSPSPAPPRPRSTSKRRRARNGSARSWPSSSASPTISVISAPSATTRPSP